MKPKTIEIIVLGLRLLVGCTFIYAGWRKLAAPEEFADGIAAYELLPARLSNLLALTLPVLELVIGAMLLSGWQRKLAYFSALVLSGLFAVALGSAMVRGLNIDCGCFGASTPSTYSLPLSFLRDLLLGAVLIFLYLRETRRNMQNPERWLW